MHIWLVWLTAWFLLSDNVFVVLKQLWRLLLVGTLIVVRRLLPILASALTAGLVLVHDRGHVSLILVSTLVDRVLGMWRLNGWLEIYLILTQSHRVLLVALRPAGAPRLWPHGILGPFAITEHLWVVVLNVALRLGVRVLSYGTIHLIFLSILGSRTERTRNQIRIQHLDVGSHMLCGLWMAKVLLCTGYVD